MGAWTVYIAHPIDFARAESGWLRLAVAELVGSVIKHGAALYQPGQAFRVPEAGLPNAVLQRINDHAIDECDALIAVLPASVMTVGTTREIGYAVAKGKPVSVVTDHVASWALADIPCYGYKPAMIDRAVHETLSAIGRKLYPLQRPTRPLPVAVQPGAQLPTRGYAFDAGLDLYCAEATEIKAGGFADVPCGVAFEFPDDVWGMIVGRSSTVRKKKLQVQTGIIDPGWRGQLYAGVWNIDQDQPYTVGLGERIAQMLLMPSLHHLQPTPVGEVRPSKDGRGQNGFGSTGH